MYFYQGTYLNLEKNPESYTGYQGRNIWPAIYQENCFVCNIFVLLFILIYIVANGEELWQEEKLFNRLISGLHASINSHIFEYFLDPDTNQFTPNWKVYFERVGNFPDRIDNIYYTFSILLR